MKVNYNYPSPSMCLQGENGTTLGLSPDLDREERVSFEGKLKNPLVFRDAMLMLREIVISDGSQKKKERVDFFAWLDDEIERRIQAHSKYLPDLEKSLKTKIENKENQIAEITVELERLRLIQSDLRRRLNSTSVWRDYNDLERKFWKFIHARDVDLWFVLDPVITVHPDIVSFEAFSVDESIYGCLSVDRDEFEMLAPPKLGTTNIDFSAKLAQEMERFRTYSDVVLSVNPEGFAVDSGSVPQHIEKKIDLPETWIKGFNQVSSAATMGGIDIELSPADMYDICSFLRRHKKNKSPRYMKWILKKGEPIKIEFAPFNKEITLQTIYSGDKNREEKMWGRRRWLVMEKLIPIAKSFSVKLLGFGLPQFISANLGGMTMTIGYSSWQSNDWVKGTSFNIMSGFIGDGCYDKVYTLLKEHRSLSMDEIISKLSDCGKQKVISGVGNLLKKGEGYFDPVSGTVRFRQLCNEPIPKHLYETTNTEFSVKGLIDEGLDSLKVSLDDEGSYKFTISYKDGEKPEITIDSDGQISKLACSCSAFNRGPRNISAPCKHILALYTVAGKFTRLNLEKNKEYNLNDIMEIFL